MARTPDPFSVALGGLKWRLRDGLAPAGEPLIVTTLAGEMAISPTPVREALSRLAGEGLVQEHRGRGFYPLRFAAPDLEELYRLHGALVDLALTLQAERGERLIGIPRPITVPPVGETARRTSTEGVWRDLARGGEAAFLRSVHARLTDQLGLARLAESMVFDDLDAELDDIRALANRTDEPALRTAITAYHARRHGAAVSIAHVIHDLRERRPL